jgi:hypothetical protein
VPQAEVALHGHRETRLGPAAARQVHHQLALGPARVHRERDLLPPQRVHHHRAGAQRRPDGPLVGRVGGGKQHVAVAREGQDAGLARRRGAELGVAEVRAGLGALGPVDGGEAVRQGVAAGVPEPHRCSGWRAARSCTHHSRSAGSRASRKGRLAVSPLRTVTGPGRAKATRPAEGAAAAAGTAATWSEKRGGGAAAVSLVREPPPPPRRARPWPPSARRRPAISPSTDRGTGGAGRSPVSACTATRSATRTGNSGRRTRMGAYSAWR